MKILIDGQTLATPEINRGIGTYFKNVIESMLRNDFVNEFYITTTSEENFAHFSPWAREKLNPLMNKGYYPGPVHSEKYVELSKIYTKTLSAGIDSEGIEVYWNPNPLMDNVFLPEKKAGCRFAATVYDLIPLIMKDAYLDRWPKVISDSYLHKLKILQEYDIFFHISQHTENDFRRYLQVGQKKHIVTPLAADDSFTYYPFPKIPSEDEYILYVSGFDPRKNMSRAIEAFAILVNKYAKEHDTSQLKLYIICASDERSKTELLNHAEKLGIKERIHFTGFVSNADLISYYQKARCLFFPSLYEGFGLPVLEALACGIPVACSNTSSLPEAGGELAQYFNPENTEEMAEALSRALKEKQDYASRQKRHEHAKSFSWPSTATKILAEFKHNTDKPSGLTKKKKIAWLSPLPPQKSGIANYSYMLVKELKKYLDIDLYYTDPESQKEIKENFNLFHISKLLKNINEYDEIVYHIGNSSKFHTEIYKLAWNYPGTVVIHDYNIHPFLKQSFLGTKDEELYWQALVEGYGTDGAKEYERIKDGGHHDIWKYPMSHAIVKRSKKAIVHHVWAKKQFEHNSRVYVVPHFAEINHTPSKDDVNRHKKKYGIKEADFVLTCLGFINKNKLPLLQIEVINKLIEQGYPIKLVFAGKLSDETKNLLEIIKKTQKPENYIVTGYQEEKEYYTSISASDIILNLRYPTMGEASGTLMQCLAAGIPTIISGINQYNEFPDIVCPKVPPENSRTHLKELIMMLLTDRNLLHQYSSNTKEYNRLFNIKKIGSEYVKILSNDYENRRT